VTLAGVVTDLHTLGLVGSGPVYLPNLKGWPLLLVLITALRPVKPFAARALMIAVARATSSGMEA
jgi:hypothetical protein